MKRIIVFSVFVILSSVEMAAQFSLDVFEVISWDSFKFRMPPDNNIKNKELEKFINECCQDSKFTDKKYVKLQDSYKKIIKDYPENKSLAMCYYGFLNITSENHLANKEEGFKLLVENEPIIPVYLRANVCKNIALCYIRGIGTSTNPQKAFEYYQRCVELSSFYSLGLAYFYLTGYGTEMNDEKAFEIFQDVYTSSSKNYYYEKMVSIILMSSKSMDDEVKKSYRDGICYKWLYLDFDKAVQKFEEASKGGMSNAMFELAHLYQNSKFFGKELSKSDRKHFRDAWFESSANRGYYPAVFEQGINKYKNGAWLIDDVKEGQAKAYSYFSNLAEEGYDPAIKEIQRVYSSNPDYNGSQLYPTKGKVTMSLLESMGNKIQSEETGGNFGSVHIKDQYLRVLYMSMTK